MSRFGYSYYGFAPYVSVAKRRANAAKEATRLLKRGIALHPVRPETKTIARSFWGKAWCTNLESYSDFSNRLPRGRTYIRNGSVLHLAIKPGVIEAMVSGSSLYNIAIKIKPVPAPQWQALCQQCAGEIGSLVDLLQGKLSERTMAVITRRETGLFPAPSEIDLDCSCPDSAGMCKHIAAVLYGVGTLLDTQPELLFTLRSVDHTQLIAHLASVAQLADPSATATEGELPEADVSAISGIELDPTPSTPATPHTEPSLFATPRAKSKLKPKSRPGKKSAKVKNSAAPKQSKPAKGKKTKLLQPAKPRRRQGNQASTPSPRQTHH